MLTGSAGVAIVVDQFLNFQEDADLATARGRLALACRADLCLNAGLFDGRIGLAVALNHMRRSNSWIEEIDMDAEANKLNFHLARQGGELVVPGDQNLRLSTDIATGSAGLMQGLGFLDGGREALPFLHVPRNSSSS